MGEVVASAYDCARCSSSGLTFAGAKSLVETDLLPVLDDPGEALVDLAFFVLAC